MYRETLFYNNEISIINSDLIEIGIDVVREYIEISGQVPPLPHSNYETPVTLDSPANWLSPTSRLRGKENRDILSYLDIAGRILKKQLQLMCDS